MDFSRVTFRCSSLGYLMYETKEKSNFQKWIDAVELKDRLISEHKAMDKFNKDGKTISANWTKKEKSILKADALILELEPLKDKVTLSETAKTHIMDLYVSITTGRNTDIENKYMKKGNAVEEDALTLYSRVKKKIYNKNEERLNNGYIMGTPDTFEGESIHNATFVPDMKSSWDLYTFYRTFTKPLAQLYFWQDIGYQWLTGARKGSIAFCLVNTPDDFIEAEQKKMYYKMGQPREGTEKYNVFLEYCSEIRKAMTYDDIDFRKRMLEYDVEWCDEYPAKIIKYVEAGREYLKQIHEQLNLKQSC